MRIGGPAKSFPGFSTREERGEGEGEKVSGLPSRARKLLRVAQSGGETRRKTGLGR